MFKPVAVIPYYNHPATIAEVVRAVAGHGLDVIVVNDGSNPPGAQALQALAQIGSANASGLGNASRSGAITLLEHAENRGKGAAMQTGLLHASAQGYSHALQIDADGQHNPHDIGLLLQAARENPASMVCGVPLYDQSVPRSRFYGRYLTHAWVWINTLSLDIRDSMCGFRIYPLAATCAVLRQHRLGQRMDFDTEILVHLHWRGVELVNIPTRVTYPPDGISHFQLWRDNWLISRMHARLFMGMLLRAPRLLWRKMRPRRGVSQS